MSTADIEGDVSNVRLQELETDHPAEITQALQKLCSKSMLSSDNRRRWSRYKIHNSPHLTENSPHLTENSPHFELQELENVAFAVANSKKAPKFKVRDVIYGLCARKSLSLEKLATLLKRNPKSLQNHYLSSMVSEGLLILQYPETPNHPDQGYIAKIAID